MGAAAQLDIRSLLDPLPVDRGVKAQAWDDFQAAATPDDYKKRLDSLQIPREAKAALWDAKFAPEDKGAALPIAQAEPPSDILIPPSPDEIHPAAMVAPAGLPRSLGGGDLPPAAPTPFNLPAQPLKKPMAPSGPIGPLPGVTAPTEFKPAELQNEAPPAPRVPVAPSPLFQAAAINPTTSQIEMVNPTAAPQPGPEVSAARRRNGPESMGGPTARKQETPEELAALADPNREITPDWKIAAKLFLHQPSLEEMGIPPPEPGDVIGGLKHGLLEASLGFISPKNIAVTLATRGLGQAFSGLVNSASGVDLISKLPNPELARKIADAAAKYAVPGLFAGTTTYQASQDVYGIFTAATPAERATKASQAALDLLMGAAQVWGLRRAVQSGRDVPGETIGDRFKRGAIHPPAQETVPEAYAGAPTQVPAPEVRAAAPEVAKTLEQAGQRLAARSWRELADWGATSSKPFQVQAGDQTITFEPVGKGYVRATNQNGEAIRAASGSIEQAKSWLDQNVVRIKANPEGGGGVSVGSGAVELADIPEVATTQAAPKSLYSRAVEIADSQPSFGASAIQRQLGIKLPEANALLGRLVTEGIIKQTTNGKGSTVYHRLTPAPPPAEPAAATALEAQPTTPGPVSAPAAGQEAAPPANDLDAILGEVPERAEGQQKEVDLAAALVNLGMKKRAATITANAVVATKPRASIEDLIRLALRPPSAAPEPEATTQPQGSDNVATAETPTIPARAPEAAEADQATPGQEEVIAERPSEITDGEITPGVSPDIEVPPAIEEPHKFSSTQVQIPEPIAERVRTAAAAIPDSELAEDGRESEPHVTVKYGLHDEEPSAVQKVLANEPPITGTIGKVSIFPAKETDVQRGGDQYDVVKLDVDSPDLHRINKKIADAMPHTDTHPTYNPHITLAYLRPGEGQKYVGKEVPGLTGQQVTFPAVRFSGKNRSTTDIPLSGKPVTPQVKSEITPGQEREAFRAWNENRAYIKSGNYHLKGPKVSGPIASWNKAIKAKYPVHEDFHAAAKAYRESQQAPAVAEPVVSKEQTPHLPGELSGAKPRYSYGPKQFDLQFANDLDRAAYIAAQAKPSKRDTEYLKFAMDATGLKEPEIRAAGARIRASIKRQAADAPKSGALKVEQYLGSGGGRDRARKGQRGSIVLNPKPLPSPSYDETKAKFIARMPEALRPELEELMRTWEKDNPGRRVIGFEEIRQQAKNLDPDLLRDLKPVTEGETLNPAVRIAAEDLLNGLNEVIYDRGKSLAAKESTMPADERLEEQAILFGLERQAKDLMDVLFPARSQDGRNLAYHRIAAEKSFDVAYWISKAKRLAGGALAPDKEQAIRETLAEGAKAEKAARAKGVPVEQDHHVKQARGALARELMTVEKSGLLETISALRRAGLLTGVKTHLRNIGGNLAFQVLEETARTPAVILDAAMALFTGQRSVQGPSSTALLQSGRAAATRGLRQAAETMRRGQTTEQLLKMERHRELNSGSKLLDAYVNGTFRLMGAEDQVFRVFAYERALASHMKAAGVKQPTEAMRAQAIADAEFATFNNENILATAFSRARSYLRTQGGTGKAAAFGMDMVVPFVRTPSNILARVIDYSGGGVVKGGWKAGKAIADKMRSDQSLTLDQQRAIAMNMGRGLVGLALIYLGWKLAEAMLLTGTTEADPGARNVSEEAGRMPGALLVNGKWHQIATFSPVGNLLTIGATLQRESTKGLRDEAKRPANLLKVATSTVMDQPMLQGTQEVVEALTNPGNKMERAAGAMAGSFVPTMVSDVSSLTDTKRRDTRGEGTLEEVLNAIKARLPLRSTLPARVSVLGRELPQSPEAAVDPTIGSEARETTDPLAKELVGQQMRIGSVSQRKDETPEEYRARRQIVGRLIDASLRDLISSDEYLDLPSQKDDDSRKLVMSKTVDHARGLVNRVVNDPEYKEMGPQRRVEVLRDLLSQ